MVTFNPALMLYLSSINSKFSNGYCGYYSFFNEFKQFIIVWLITDMYEAINHFMGHYSNYLWTKHKAHHKYFLPTPFSVIADDFFDQVTRTIPLILWPLFFNINLELLLFQWMIFYGLFGTYLHYGFELSFLSAHNPIVNTSYHHHLHHAKSGKNKPICIAFFFKFIDKILGSDAESNINECLCSRCEIKKGNRTKEIYDKIEKPNYYILFNPKFWLYGDWNIEIIDKNLKND